MFDAIQREKSAFADEVWAEIISECDRQVGRWFTLYRLNKVSRPAGGACRFGSLRVLAARCAGAFAAVQRDAKSGRVRLYSARRDLARSRAYRHGTRHLDALTALMLESLALDDANPAGAFALPQPMRANLARAAKEQLREILGCAPARITLIRAYFEAALLADTGRPARPGESSLAA